MSNYNRRITIIAMTLLSIGIFVTPYIMRRRLLPSNIEYINLVTLVGIMVLWLSNYMTNERKLRFVRVCFFRVFMILMLLSLLFFVSMVSGSSIQNALHYYIVIILPILLLFIKIKNVNKIPQMIRIWNIFLNMCIWLIVLCGLVDTISSMSVSLIFKNFYNVSSLTESLNQGRMISYLGHPLETAEFVLIYFVFNYIECCYLNINRNHVAYIAISFIAMAMTGSKSGLLILACITIFLNATVKNIRYILAIGVTMFIFYKVGLFNLVINRFADSISKGDITTGRNSSLANMLNSSLFKFNFFYGHQINPTDNKIIAALEYPVLRWAYQVGIVFSAIFTSVVYVFPIVKIALKKHFNILICMLALILQYNMSNGMASVNDDTLIFCICMFLIFNITNYLSVVKKIDT